MTTLADLPPLLLPAPVVLFDLDGTLTDSAAGVIDGFRHALATVGVPEPAHDEPQRVLGPPMIDTLRGLGLDEQQVQRALTAYIERYDERGWAENSVFDGVATMLGRVRDAGSRLAVATSKNQNFAVRILEHFELAGHFDFIGGASDDGTRRAKADVIAHSLVSLGVDPVAAADGGTGGVVMVGDREHDVTGAARWGIPTVFVEWGYGAADEAADAHRSTSSVGELTRVLTGGR
ncbi:HAD hydrolase-like protein [Rhodococcus sp. GXMU-t2271]|uniref:Hydrolase n=1 Tax=Rhodococcus ruber BKS 20-38 TaxID=1278076 RepID=M2ZSH0_9NOCA|nr:HAD hydrolase-like protein [Rhodococcus ruber]EME63294.1 hydrolase [Rhodococcus ruber BKS 20-38]